MSFATSTPTRLNFSNSVCSTQGLSAKVRARFFPFSPRVNFFARAVSLSPFFPPLWIKKIRSVAARARAIYNLTRPKNWPNFLTRRRRLELRNRFRRWRLKTELWWVAISLLFRRRHVRHFFSSSFSFSFLSVLGEFNLTLFLSLSFHFISLSARK